MTLTKVTSTHSASTTRASTDVTMYQVPAKKVCNTCIFHVMVLRNKGHIYTFGINNKRRCGHDYVSGAGKEGELCNISLFLCHFSLFRF